MEFFYEEQAIESGNGTSDVPEAHDNSTEEAFQKFEGSIDKQYQKTAKAVKNLINDEQGLELNLPLDSRLSGRAQGALDSLDKQLHDVENAAQDYWKKMSNNSFWSSMTGSLSSKLEEVVKLSGGNPASNTGPSGLRDRAGTPIAGNRTDAELRLLSSDKSLYLDNADAIDEKDFDVDALTSEISELLESNSTLTQTMNSIVPEKISYSRFWCIYFSRKDKILAMEYERKELLKPKNKEEDTVSWDEDDDEVEVEDGSNSLEPKTGAGTLPGASIDDSAREKKPLTVEGKESEDDDEDDGDWE
ncbi:LADA_0A04984g1_1 [Lachancea dasiensis]|uniref:LADA_0A04984g1_1 n=1 Tax=Lachancea dasiensis TaxID=1072105 RepID=A0A1G4IPA8_9SACH|nr:LADA_0A04984g1_1 [Lachancea dasiensis]